MERRLFIAFPVSEKIREESARIVRHFPDAPVRWVRPEDLHITAVAPWISKSMDADAKRLLQVAKHARPFTIRFGLVEPGPTIVAPRLIWIKGKIHGVYPASLQKQLATAFDRGHDFKKWLPHVTIGRFRQDMRITSPVRTVYEDVDIEERITSMLLMESHRTREGVRYSVLRDAHFEG